MALSAVRRTSWPAKFAARVYAQYVLPALTFGLEVCSLPAVGLDRLQKIQNEYCRDVLRAPRHAHLLTMHNELGLRKIQDVVDANTLNFYNKFKFTFDIDARFALIKIYNFFALLQIYDVMPAAAGPCTYYDPVFRTPHVI